ncbi:hypothetical protein PCASD_16813 [Puccinia coronata f. sp. avenae]|uniref:Uncharacterized protein n=1 Tax=Puccinia coronata f. sp. avenae TaxID=200324 RepID=A0A2N5T063_9BASI|nr:hypothetical protein PCASD_16813 [Puccinia coronata f. sp. avenae]
MLGGIREICHPWDCVFLLTKLIRRAGVFLLTELTWRAGVFLLNKLTRQAGGAGLS